LHAAQSKRKREEGNKEYKRAFSEGMCATVRDGALQRALQCYNQAVDLAAPQSDDACSANKNLGTVHICISKTGALTPSLRRYHVLQGLAGLSTAFEQGKRNGKPASWCQQLGTSLDSATEACFADEALLRSYLPLCSDQSRAANIALRAARNIFNESVATLSVEGFAHVLYLVYECRWPLEEARRLGGPEIREEVEELAEGVFLQQCLAEAMQLKHVALERLEEALQRDEALEINGVWQCLDTLKQAAMTAQQGRGVESEAEMVYHIARVYEMCLPWAIVHARGYYGRSMQLSKSLSPKIPTAPWYQALAQKIQAHQKAITDAEDAEEAKEREPILREKKEALDVMRKAFDKDKGGSIKKGIEHIYKEHPPQAGYKAPEFTPETTKDALRAAIRDYHPDKHAARGMVWKVLCEEIVKVLNEKYELFKR